MLGGARQSRYSVKLARNLPSGKSPCAPQDATFGDALLLCTELVAASRQPCMLERDVEDAVHALQATNFFHVLLRAFGLTKTSDLEWLFHGMSHSRSDFWSGNSGRARKYKAGKHLPHDSWLRSLEQRLGIDLTSDVHQLLFRSLVTTAPVSDLLGTLLRSPCFLPVQLVDSLLMRVKDASLQEMTSWCNLIIARAGMGALGALVVLLRDANERNDRERVDLLTKYVVGVLLMLGPELQARGIAARLFAVCLERLFPSVGVEVRDMPEDLARLSAALTLIGFLPRPTSTEPRKWTERVSTMSAVLRGEYPHVAGLFLPTRGNTELAEARRIRDRAWRGLLQARRSIRPDDSYFQLEGTPPTLRFSDLLRSVPAWEDLFQLARSSPAVPAWYNALSNRGSDASEQRPAEGFAFAPRAPARVR